MKLRIRGNSLRLRVTQSELAQFVQTGQVSEVVTFAPDSQFSYRLQRADVDTIGATLIDNKVTVAIPQRQATQWAQSNEVSLRGADGELRLLIEKDFACLVTREGEDDSDAFPNPQAVESAAQSSESA